MKDILEKVIVEEYLYDLPESRIAKFPLEDRAQSKLLVVSKDNNEIDHKLFFDLPAYIPENSLIVWNDTKVIPARIPVVKPSGGKAEFLLLKPIRPFSEFQTAMTATSPVVWSCVAGGRKLVEGLELKLDGVADDFSLIAKVVAREDNRAEVEFSWDTSVHKTFSEVLDFIGKTPLPPYMKRESTELDKTRYQTVYAQFDGSVAAPTAGLHFTDKVIADLRDKNIDFASVTLHVGLGTFKPIECANAAEHSMHRELISVSLVELNRILDALKNKRKITAIGTTSVRTLETLYWLGVKMIEDKSNDFIFELSQFEPYYLSDKFDANLPSAEESFSALLCYCENNKMEQICGETQLMIAPGYKFAVCDAIVTNFHQPHSTLILLVAAFLGKELWRKAYNSALANEYRFLSYGDSSILM